MNTSTDRLLIVAITPLILERGLLWFEKNSTGIERARTKLSFWQKNTIVLEKGQKTALSELTRRLSDFGYFKYETVELPGEFSQLGGTLTLFPVNIRQAYRIEFYGNTVAGIAATNRENPAPEKPLSEIIYEGKKRRSEIPHDLVNLKEGDYVVHLDHGIGRFYKKKYIHLKDDRLSSVYVLEYANSDTLTVPEEIAYKLSPYIGFQTPEIHRLGGNLWHKIRRKVKEDIIKTAKELLSIYAKREIAERPVYSAPDDMFAELVLLFSYEQTLDQKRTIEEIMRDFEKPVPMDRVVCGDVGFGKTEVAIRSAARAAFSGRQVALIAPTTILAWQHFQTFSERFYKFPVTVALLSRVQRDAEQKKILRDLQAGSIDILIGTHRVLQNDVQFKNLSLLIIDEEQRFGVKQKEKLKGLKSALDIISLSATPIPRTLYVTLSGLKNISLIQTPPANRLAIKTFVVLRSKKIIRDAIFEELNRGGQIYYLHNRIATIETALSKIRELAPSHARLAIAHAKLPDSELINVIEDFRNKKTDILIATTIIENGLDLSNVNTLIVEDATRLGLAQAHQLRGRIGRGDKQAFAYFLYSKKKMTETGARRLEALQLYQGLGQGYEIAIRDLEIRGAGNILGKEQHGSINRVGLNLYCQMLNEAVEQLKANQTDSKSNATFIS
ncbi:MAG: DEAD/DEAH box helicase [Candidatus Spechtbacteria bacterium]|nr:DEAD/DEAH box helicase [Candidatus Spechtbacteria bacterium]